MNGLALCAGYAGIELGLKLLFGEAYRVVCYVEREAYDAATLVARMEDSSLDKAPVWDDLTTFNGQAWRNLVDILTAGFPCQPWSQAGKRKGREDARWLWPAILRIIRQVSPRVVFLENVTGLLTEGLGHVLADLAESGFDAEWGVFSAAQLGAPHRRERVFILGYARSSRRNRHIGWHDGEVSQARRPLVVADSNVDGKRRRRGDSHRKQRALHSQQRSQGESIVALRSETLAQPEHGGRKRRNSKGKGAAATMPSSPTLADAHDFRQQAAAGHIRTRESDTTGSSPPMGDADTLGLKRRSRKIVEEAGRRQSADADCLLYAFPPGRDDHEGWARYLEKYPGLEPAVCRGVDGAASRMDRVAATGNEVVPVVVAYAYSTLAARFESE